MVVANDVYDAESGFGVDTNRVTMLFPDGREQALPLMSKDHVASVVMERVVSQLLI
jgi:phosphopantothenoylcysteine decarboxylase/phosphopantothenate--cysteine ligase